MSNLKAGFARVNINPPMGIFVSGYFKDRFADGILDDLEANALAISLGDTTQLLINVDIAGIKQEISAEYRERISKVTSVPTDNIFISCTHTHTGPEVNNDQRPLVLEYREFLGKRLADVAMFAVNDLKDAKMGYGVGKAENVAFVRRFIMKDGTTKTNPGVNNPDIVRPVGQIDDSVNVIRFDREGADTIVFVNFANHPDVVGGCKISGDWPTLLRKNVEKILDNTKCIFFNGAQGDINHVNVHPKGGDLNGMFIDFDDVSRGYSHAQYIARVVTGGVLQVYDKVNYIDVDSIKGRLMTINVPSNKPTPAELPEAHRINDLHLAGKDSELPYEGMMLTTVVAEAGRMVRLENAPDAFDMTLSGFRLGPIAFVGIPGEPFNAIGRGLKETEGYDLIIPCCITNGYQGYFPMQDSYDEGGYEARSSNFKAGVGEFIIEEGKKLLESLR
ncbi:MAG: hypothetical protein E7406_02545 [Ruminococcaceae bacterium]|nr:hypothetical protein [Oscillospiraceae bacterium]